MFAVGLASQARLSVCASARHGTSASRKNAQPATVILIVLGTSRIICSSRPPPSTAVLARSQSKLMTQRSGSAKPHAGRYLADRLRSRWRIPSDKEDVEITLL